MIKQTQKRPSRKRNTPVLHTPEPWKYDRTQGCRAIKAGKVGSQRQAQYKAIANTVGLYDDDEDEANARLMAAAPRLLAFTELLASYGCASIDQDPDDVQLCGKCGTCEALAFLEALNVRSRAKA